MVKNTLNQKSLLLLYNSIFHCHLLYALQIWSWSRSGPQNEIFKMQKAAIRIVSGSSYNSHTEPLFKKLQVLPLPDLITFSKLQFMHRFSQKFLPSSFNNTWIKNLIRNIGETKYSSETSTNYNMPILACLLWMSFLFTIFLSCGKNSLMSRSRLFANQLNLTLN